MTGSLQMHYISVSAKSGDLVVFSVRVDPATPFLNAYLTVIGKVES